MAQCKEKGLLNAEEESQRLGLLWLALRVRGADASGSDNQNETDSSEPLGGMQPCETLMAAQRDPLYPSALCDYKI